MVQRRTVIPRLRLRGVWHRMWRGCMDCFAGAVIGRALAQPVGSQWPRL